MITFKRISSELVQIWNGPDCFTGEFTYMDGHWMCVLTVSVDRVAFEGILKRMQQLCGFEPPYYTDKYIMYMGVNCQKHKFKLSDFVRVEATDNPTRQRIICQNDDDGIREYITIDTEEDILGAVKYGQERILTKSTPSGPE